VQTDEGKGQQRISAATTLIGDVVATDELMYADRSVDAKASLSTD